MQGAVLTDPAERLPVQGDSRATDRLRAEVTHHLQVAVAGHRGDDEMILGIQHRHAVVAPAEQLPHLPSG